LKLITATLDWLAIIVLVITLVLMGLLILRVILNWVDANPFGRVSYHLTRLTEPLVHPLRYQFGGGRYTRYNLLPLVMGVMILVTGFFIYSTLKRFSIILSDMAPSPFPIGTLAPVPHTRSSLIANIIRLLGLFYVAAIFLRFFLPFFGVGYRNKVFRFLFNITEPLLKPIRRFFVFGMFDFSPILLMILIEVIIVPVLIAIAEWLTKVSAG